MEFKHSAYVIFLINWLLCCYIRCSVPLGNANTLTIPFFHWPWLSSCPYFFTHLSQRSSHLSNSQLLWLLVSTNALFFFFLWAHDYGTSQWSWDGAGHMNYSGQKPVMKATFINSLLKHFMAVWDPLVFFFKPPAVVAEKTELPYGAARKWWCPVILGI